MSKEIIFPIIYDLRIIYRGDSAQGIEHIEKLLKDMSIMYKPGVIKPGGKSDLVRLAFNVTIMNKQQMDVMYGNLNTIPGIKWAT
ncbi:MAG: hypothetical protein B6229_00895 [Spirochaetaceae bacterium 4572_7]|nr:MAG: hypothetical protein B6229_00895 [Spirochaetaceae bacterium 4572_7]